jgi:parallel beta-helix repeat protein
VFVDGVQLKQVASASQVVPGTFAVNDAADTLTIGTDPTGKALRASDLKMAFALSGGSTIQGIGVRRYATPHDVGAAVRLGSPGGALRQMVITDNAMQGVALSNINKVVDHVVATNNGQLGVGGMELDGSVLKNSVINGNNSENFNNEPVSGGVKITQSRGIKAINNEVKDNKSAGMWFDASSYQIVATNNDFVNNRSTQLELEVSAQGTVANNTMTGGQTGILIHDTSDVLIYNNKVGDYSIFGLKISQDTRRQADASVPEAHDKRRPVPDPTVTWITQNIKIVNNVFGSRSTPSTARPTGPPTR